ncbi:winged helix DNA-binding domain-containing protein [Dactylosporangium roseum]|uniref:winged helix DNA-binding domain-containing protein n=1 Tax=Dactylosporangium roseum TaxID=47989 RepID=UPI0021B4577E|nr:winged helix DNA-binding domain-containing protein [Dactylosporangium roseum]
MWPGRAAATVRPGALLVDGDVAGTWRAKLSGTRLTLTVTPFEPLTARIRTAMTAEAETIAAARGATTVTVA